MELSLWLLLNEKVFSAQWNYFERFKALKKKVDRVGHLNDWSDFKTVINLKKLQQKKNRFSMIDLI